MEKNRILIIGVGSIGERHLRCFQKTDRCDLAICEPVAERRDDVAKRYGVAAFASWEEALGQDDFVAAVIASPAPYHIPLAQKLAERGLHLLIEKPLSLTLDGVAELIDCVAANAIKVSVGFNFRSLPTLKDMQRAIAGGRFGRPVQINVSAGQHFPFYRPAYRDIYYARHDLGGGAIQDLLPHQLNAAEWMVGPTTKVVADCDHCVLEGVEVEDTVHVLTRHGEVMGALSLNQHQAANEFAITVMCERGAARWELNEQRWLSAEENGGEWSVERTDKFERDDFYILQANAFLDHLAGGGPAPCSLAAGLQTLKATLAIKESIEKGGWVGIN